MAFSQQPVGVRVHIEYGLYLEVCSSIFSLFALYPVFVLPVICVPVRVPYNDAYPSQYGCASPLLAVSLPLFILRLVWVYTN